MKALRLIKAAPIELEPLELGEVQLPEPGPLQLLIRVRASGICLTDLHTVEGDIQPPVLPITPGHQVIGEVFAMGERVQGWEIGERAGVPWLHRACERCDYCRRGEQNLCREAEFTGFHVDGGHAELMLSDSRYTLKIPSEIDDDTAAPLLCAGIVGYRSLRKAEVKPGERIGLVGFGASAHLVIQVARHWECEVYVFTRSEGHRQLARSLGAAWVGGAEQDGPQLLDRAIIFAPAGHLVPTVLAKIRPGGTLVLNAIHMSPIPEFPYALIWEERTVRSVANATYQDGLDFLRLAAEIQIRPQVTEYALTEGNRALQDLKSSRIEGAGVLIP